MKNENGVMGIRFGMKGPTNGFSSREKTGW